MTKLGKKCLGEARGEDENEKDATCIVAWQTSHLEDHAQREDCIFCIVALLTVHG